MNVDFDWTSRVGINESFDDNGSVETDLSVILNKMIREEAEDTGMINDISSLNEWEALFSFEMNQAEYLDSNLDYTHRVSNLCNVEVRSTMYQLQSLETDMSRPQRNETTHHTFSMDDTPNYNVLIQNISAPKLDRFLQQNGSTPVGTSTMIPSVPVHQCHGEAVLLPRPGTLFTQNSVQSIPCSNKWPIKNRPKGLKYTKRTRKKKHGPHNKKPFKIDQKDNKEDTFVTLRNHIKNPTMKCCSTIKLDNVLEK